MLLANHPDRHMITSKKSLQHKHKPNVVTNLRTGRSHGNSASAVPPPPLCISRCLRSFQFQFVPIFQGHGARSPRGFHSCCRAARSEGQANHAQHVPLAPHTRQMHVSAVQRHSSAARTPERGRK